MQSAVIRKLKWAVPVGIAAAIVLVVGIWPEHGQNGTRGGSGRVYAMSDVPALLKATRTMYIKHSVYQRDPTRPDQEPVKAEGEVWVDFTTGRRFTTRRNHSEPAELGYQHTVCDGEYVMQEYTAQEVRGRYSLGVRFKKLTPYQAMLETRQGDFLTQLFGRVDQATGFEVTGQEEIDGESFNIWEGTIEILPQAYRLKVWLSPTSGNIARVQYWDEPADGSPWQRMFIFERIERDVALPEGLFSTEPRPGYKLENTKETAPVQALGTSGIERAWVYALHQHISFRLPDGSVLFGWGVYDETNTDPEPLFSNLLAGGGLPDLPARPVSLRPVPTQGDLKYVGRHLAYTRYKKNYCVEWSLYVPDQPPSPDTAVLTYKCDMEYTADKTKFGSWFDGVSGSLPIASADEFNTWVLGAMADLSETGAAPDHVTYEFTLDLCKRIRTELENTK